MSGLLKYLLMFSIAAALLLGNAQLDPEHPGIVARIHQRGVDLLQKVAFGYLTSIIKGYEVPPISKEGAFSYEFKNINITSFSFGDVSVDLVPPRSVEVRFDNAYLTLTGNWNAETTIFWKKRKYSGRFDAEVINASLVLSTELGIDDAGRPRIASTDCTATIGYLNIEVDQTGFLGYIYNSIIRLANKPMKKVLKSATCASLVNVIEQQGMEWLPNFNLSLPLVLGTMMDVSLVTAPEVRGDTLEIYFRGRCFPDHYPMLSYPFRAPPIPDFINLNKMFQFVASDYVLNTFLYSVSQTSALDLWITDDMLPEDSYVRLTVDFFREILVAFRQFKTGFIRLLIRPVTPPMGTLSPGKIQIEGKFQCVIYVERSDDPLLNAFTMDMDIMVVGNVTFQNQTISARINNSTITTSLNNTNVGVIPVSFIDSIIQGEVSNVILPALNEYLGRGFQLPDIFGFSAVNTSVVIKEHVVELESDVMLLSETIV